MADANRGRRRRVALVVGLLSVMVLVSGVTVTWWATRPRGHGGTGLIQDPERVGRPEFSASPGTTIDPRATIPGLSITALNKAWSQRWHVTFSSEKDPLYSLADLPLSGTKVSLRIGTTKTTESPADAPRQVHCTARTDARFINGKAVSPLVVDRTLLRRMVDVCLTPVLQDAERQDVPAWLYATDFSTISIIRQDFPRFTVQVMCTDVSMSIALIAR